MAVKQLYLLRFNLSEIWAPVAALGRNMYWGLTVSSMLLLKALVAMESVEASG